MSDATETVIEEDLPAEGDEPEASGADAETDVAEGAEAGTEGETEGAEAEAELVVSLGEEDEPDETTDSPVIRDIRKAQKEAVRGLRAKERELAEARAEIQRLKGTGSAPEAIGQRPTLAACDYDEDKFAAELEAWNSRKFAADQAAQKKREAEEQAQAKWLERVQSVEKAGQTLKVRDSQDAVETFGAVFSPLQQAIAIRVLKDPKDAALMRYALGKNPAVAKRLAAEQDPVEFAGEVCRIFYKELNVKPRKAAPAPETVVRSSVAGAAAVDKALVKLQEEADRTGDRSKVAKYLRDKQRAKQAA